MTRLLIMEGNPASRRENAAAQGVSAPGEIYAQAILACYPDIKIDTYFGADEDSRLPRPLDAYDGFVVSGSSLHAYDQSFAVTNQIDMLRRAASVGLPILGSCWGLQIAAIAGGGKVARNPQSAEMGIARKITPTAQGYAHPLLKGRHFAFDAPCIHYDDVTELPEGAVLLASNAHSRVQAAVIPLGRSEVWAVQYHPEFDLLHVGGLLRYYARDLVTGGFFKSEGDAVAYARNLAEIANGQERNGAAWQLAVDADLIDPSTRRREILNWLEFSVGHVPAHASA